LLGYREALFPILFEGTGVGVFFIGQIVLEHKEQLIEECMKALLSRQPHCFDDYLKREGRSRQPEDILGEILEQHRAWIARPGNILTEKGYKQLLSDTCGELAKFEQQLQTEMDEQRQRYIGEKVTARIGRFRTDLPSDVPLDGDPLKPLWENVARTVGSLAEDFALRYVVVFGVPSLTTKEQSVLDIVAQAGSLPDQFSDTQRAGRVKLDLAGLRPESNTQIIYASRRRNPEYLDRLLECDLDACGDLALVFLPVPLHPQSSIAILVGYWDHNPSASPENAPGADLDTALQSFDSLVVSSLSAILATTAQRHTHDQLRILGHEAGQLIAGLDWMSVTYLANPSRLRDLEERKARDLCQDLEGFQRQLRFIFDRAALLTRELPQLNKEVFRAFSELLFKWKDIYRLEAVRRALQFVTVLEGPSDRDRPAVFGDRMLLEQLVYNLVNNAVKYCYRGTKIHLDCRLKSREKGSPHVFTVTDYGREMPNTEQIFDLYWRGHDSEEGLGIGLHVARRIALAHGGSICFESLKVSDYNVPLIEPYLRPHFHFSGEPAGLRDALRDELNRLDESRGYNEIIARTEQGDPKYAPSIHALADEIKRPTYRVTVMVEIPRAGGGSK
jgi:signal transduction histidine kinase